MKDLNIPLNDIAPLVEIPDYSLYYFIAIVIVMWLFAASIAFIGWRYWKNKKRSYRREMFDKLTHIDLNDPKSAAYTISHIGRIFEKDNERTAKAYHNLFERLTPYKYAPIVEKIDQETLGYFHLYLEMIDV